jgi:hypothetical protein
MDLGLLVGTRLVVSSMSLSEKQPQQYSWVVESLADNPKFIKVRFRISRFITVVVDTKADQANIKALYLNLESASTYLKVSIF